MSTTKKDCGVVAWLPGLYEFSSKATDEFISYLLSVPARTYCNKLERVPLMPSQKVWTETRTLDKLTELYEGRPTSG